ncbi:hypothetical protein [Streptomyces sp. NBC_00645]|uniref:hypothetical protein n=1 Tax=Streptomyces sp. NBC_00645 TaxID=2975795 RepID=UPI00324FA555
MDLPDDLINLERDAEEQRARMAGLTGDEADVQRQAWREAAAKAQAAITAHAEAAGLNRYEVGQAVKRAARGTEQDPTE